jgi:hypothetical protein
VLSDPNYRAAIDCRGKRQTVIGYVYTDRAKRPFEHERDADARDPGRLCGFHQRRHDERAEQGSDDQAEDVTAAR